MATSRINDASPVPVKLRNYETVTTTLIEQVKKAAHETVSHSAARSAVIAALATINDGGLDGSSLPPSPEPTEWESFTNAVDHIINASEAAPSKSERLKLLDTALSYLGGLADAIAEEEAVRQSDRGFFVTTTQALNHNYLIAAMAEAMSDNTVLTFEAS